MPIGAGPLGPERRLDAVRRWPVRPDVASVGFDEEGAADLAAGLLDQAVGVEASVATPEAAEALLRSGLASRSHRIAIAPREQDLAAACAAIHAIEQVLDGAAPGVPRLLHGTEATAWGLVAEAGRRGYDVRMGLEDTTRLPDGMVAHDNGELIRTALAVHRAAELGSDLVARRPAMAPGPRRPSRRPRPPPCAPRPAGVARRPLSEACTGLAQQPPRGSSVSAACRGRRRRGPRRGRPRRAWAGCAGGGGRPAGRRRRGRSARRRVRGRRCRARRTARGAAWPACAARWRPDGGPAPAPALTSTARVVSAMPSSAWESTPSTQRRTWPSGVPSLAIWWAR